MSDKESESLTGDEFAIMVFIGLFICLIIVAGFMGFNADEEEWTKVDDKCYLNVHKHKSLWSDDYTETGTYCIRP